MGVYSGWDSFLLKYGGEVFLERPKYLPENYGFLVCDLVWYDRILATFRRNLQVRSVTSCNTVFVADTRGKIESLMVLLCGKPVMCCVSRQPPML